MYGTLSPLMLIAGEGLMKNIGLSINADLILGITTYNTSSSVAAYAGVISAAESALITTNPSPPPATIASPSLNDIYTFANNTCPALVNATPNLANIGSTTNRFTAQLLAHANNILGNGDLSKFVVQMYTVMSYTVSSGNFIDAAVASNSYLGPTFSSMDELTTGNISGITLATQEFGSDLVNTGKLIDLSRLDIYGTPESLIFQLYKTGLLKYISYELSNQGVSTDGLISKINSLGVYENLPMVIQKKAYQAFQQISGTKLDTIKLALKINISAGVSTLADLIDTKKIFPSCYRTLTSPVKSGNKAIYLNASGNINSIFSNLGKKYYSAMPRDIADANVAMRKSLQQIKNISNLQTASFGKSVQKLETNYGLDLINSIDNPLPSSVYSYYTENFANGSGSNGRYYLSDGIGTPAGITHKDTFSSINLSLISLSNAGALDDLNEIFGKLETFLKNFIPDGFNTYVIPGIGGPYLTYEDGINDCLTAATTEISNIAASYPTEYDNLNTQFINSVNQIEKELDTLNEAGVVFNETPSNKQSIMSMVQNLHTYAKQDEYRGPAELLEKMADQTTQAGQALVGALREGRNISNLNKVGVGMDNVPDTPAEPADGTGDFKQAIYSVDEAIANNPS